MNRLVRSRWRFRPAPAVTLAAVLVVGATAALGSWQHRRAEEKLALGRELEARSALPPVSLRGEPIDAQALEFRRVRVRGEFVPTLSVLLDNKLHAGAAGYQVVTPLRIEGGARHVLVNRGWIAAGPARERLPSIETPAGPQDIEAIARVPSRRFLELGRDASSGPLRQNLVIERLERELRLPLEPVVLQQTSAAADGLVRSWDRPDTGADKHRAYSLQWYSLAALAVVLYVSLNLKRAPSGN